MNDNKVPASMACPNCHEDSTDILLIGDGQDMAEDEVLCEWCQTKYRLNADGTRTIL